MKERPILFSASMVRAILAGQKTQTRRIVKPRVVPIVEECFRVNGKWCNHTFDYDLVELSPYGSPGDRLWVKETCRITTTMAGYKIRYRADDAELWPDTDGPCYDDHRWRPSIHMPRCASRILLEITAVRVERLNDISEADALAEGVNVHPDHHGKPRTSIYSPVQAYCDLWESINGVGSWVLNPWVWVIEFRRVMP